MLGYAQSSVAALTQPTGWNGSCLSVFGIWAANLQREIDMLKLVHSLGILGILAGCSMFLPEMIYGSHAGPGDGYRYLSMGGFFVIVAAMVAWFFLFILTWLTNQIVRRIQATG